MPERPSGYHDDGDMMEEPLTEEEQQRYKEWFGMSHELTDKLLLLSDAELGEMCEYSHHHFEKAFGPTDEGADSVWENPDSREVKAFNLGIELSSLFYTGHAEVVKKILRHFGFDRV